VVMSGLTVVMDAPVLMVMWHGLSPTQPLVLRPLLLLLTDTLRIEVGMVMPRKAGCWISVANSCSDWPLASGFWLSVGNSTLQPVGGPSNGPGVPH
jgi:hypothetical protein